MKQSRTVKNKSIANDLRKLCEKHGLDSGMLIFGKRVNHEPNCADATDWVGYGVDVERRKKVRNALTRFESISDYLTDEDQLMLAFALGEKHPTQKPSNAVVISGC